MMLPGLCSLLQDMVHQILVHVYVSYLFSIYVVRKNVTHDQLQHVSPYSVTFITYVPFLSIQQTIQHWCQISKHDIQQKIDTTIHQHNL